MCVQAVHISEDGFLELGPLFGFKAKWETHSPLYLSPSAVKKYSS